VVCRCPYSRTVAIAAATFSTGLIIDVAFLIYYMSHGFHLSDTGSSYLAVTGLFLMIAGFVTFTFALLLHATAVVVWRK